MFQDKDNKTVNINLRVTQETKDFLMKLADKDRRTLSDYLRLYLEELAKQSFLKTAFTESSMVVDAESGEVIEQSVKQVKILANNREHFFIIYASLIGLLQEMSGPETKVYSYILYHYINASEIALPKGMKEIIAEKLNLKLGTVNNAISSLSEKKLIYSTHRGIYKINPRYAFKGSTKERNALLKVVLEVECPDC